MKTQLSLRDNLGREVHNEEMEVETIPDVIEFEGNYFTKFTWTRNFGLVLYKDIGKNYMMLQGIKEALT